jgi:hypothetical protein
LPQLVKDLRRERILVLWHLAPPHVRLSTP